MQGACKCSDLFTFTFYFVVIKFSAASFDYFEYRLIKTTNRFDCNQLIQTILSEYASE